MQDIISNVYALPPDIIAKAREAVKSPARTDVGIVRMRLIPLRPAWCGHGASLPRPEGERGSR